MNIVIVQFSVFIIIALFKHAFFPLYKRFNFEKDKSALFGSLWFNKRNLISHGNNNFVIFNDLLSFTVIQTNTYNNLLNLMVICV